MRPSTREESKQFMEDLIARRQAEDCLFIRLVKALFVSMLTIVLYVAACAAVFVVIVVFSQGAACYFANQCPTHEVEHVI